MTTPDVTAEAWNDWIRHPITAKVIRDLSDGYSIELRSLARAVIDRTGKEQIISGRIEKTEEILGMFRASVPENLDPEAEDNEPDPATIAGTISGWQDSTLGAT